MKKFPIIISSSLLLASLASLSGCSKTKKIDLLFGDNTATDVQTISYDKLKEKVDSKETFLLAVQYSDGCACWQTEAHPVLKKYVEEKHVNIYHIKLQDLDEGGSRFGITIVSGNVSFAIFEDGEAKHSITTHDDTRLKKYSEFAAYLDSLVALPRIYYVSIDDLDKMRVKDEKNIIYYARKTCGDCSYIDSHFLKNWSKEHQSYSKKIYVLDCDQPDIRLDDEDKYNKEQWFQFKDDYGMSTKNNADFGYDTGYVPSFYLMEGSVTGPKYLMGAVAFNDELKSVDGEYVVTNSYYTEERLAKLSYIDDKVETKVLKGLKVSEDNITKFGEYISWNHEAAEKYHNVFLEKFLDYCEKQ